MICPNCGEKGTIIKKYDEWDGYPYYVCIKCWVEFDEDEPTILIQINYEEYLEKKKSLK